MALWEWASQDWGDVPGLGLLSSFLGGPRPAPLGKGAKLAYTRVIVVALTRFISSEFSFLLTSHLPRRDKG